MIYSKITSIHHLLISSLVFSSEKINSNPSKGERWVRTQTCPHSPSCLLIPFSLSSWDRTGPPVFWLLLRIQLYLVTFSFVQDLIFSSLLSHHLPFCIQVLTFFLTQTRVTTIHCSHCSQIQLIMNAPFSKLSNGWVLVVSSISPNSVRTYLLSPLSTSLLLFVLFVSLKDLPPKLFIFISPPFFSSHCYDVEEDTQVRRCPRFLAWLTEWTVPFMETWEDAEGGHMVLRHLCFNVPKGWIIGGDAKHRVRKESVKLRKRGQGWR